MEIDEQRPEPPVIRIPLRLRLVWRLEEFKQDCKWRLLKSLPDWVLYWVTIQAYAKYARGDEPPDNVDLGAMLGRIERHTRPRKLEEL